MCRSERLALAFALTPTPPANAFVQEKVLSEDQPVFPLDVYFCEECFHLQLCDIVDPKLLFSEYVYVSGTSKVFVDHFRDYAKEIVERCQLNSDSLVVEIGSNDGTLLRQFKNHGVQVLGIDPARRIAEEATASGIRTETDFFTAACADQIASRFGQADIICANNVFAHIDDLADVVNGVRALLKPTGTFVFEVSYLVDVIKGTLFDTIYHEHLSYHSVLALAPFFESHGMELYHAERVSTHGGSLRGFVRRKGVGDGESESIVRLKALEESMGLNQLMTFRKFAENINELKETFTSLLKKLRQEGKSIAGFGAPAKATTLMYHFGLGKDAIEFIVDDSPLKQGLYSPGLKVPILSSKALVERRPDYLVVLAWNFADSIIKNNIGFKNEGGRFIVPLPTVQIV